MIKKIILLSFVCFQIISIHNIFGQIPDFNSKLTKKQMYADFDYFVQLIDSSTQTLVRKQATGYDAAAEIRKKRTEIKKIKSYREFISFLDDCLPYTMCEHARMANEADCNYTLGVKFIDTQKVRLLAQAYRKYTDSLSLLQNGFDQLGIGFYHNGIYHVFGRYKFVKFSNSQITDSIVLTNFSVLKRNHAPIDIFKDGEVKRANAASIRWDYNLQHYYVTYGLYIPRTITISGASYPSKTPFEINLANFNGINCSSASFSEEERLSLSREKSDPMKVTYYDSLHLLYIYMGTMAGEDGRFADSVKKVGMGKKIDKIILDIRGNNGGNDNVWGYLLQAIIKNPIPIYAKLGVRNTTAMRRIFDNTFPLPHDTNRIKVQKIAYLDNAEYITLISGGIYEDDSICFIPDTNSLQFDGNIYILQDESVFSSASALVACANHVPQLTTVGVPTGLMCGRGMVAALFQLPNSYFSFVMEIFCDMTGAKSAIDVWQDRPEIELYPTLDEIIEMNNYGCLNKRGDEFLFKHDYLFKKVLELP
jgi:hypothetical protein